MKESTLSVTPELKARVERNGAQWAREALTKAKDPVQVFLTKEPV